ncbi:transposase, Mutator family [Rhodopirellula maiorica SM1]|uniref:Transposase, Mutator family n=1 Tax=Rhodopirellula maiorica SM1 TaxID=1265738 RepID=M5RWV2_9BACT|nr:transposase [Rhodopirellula maiorica]EMI18429.1 transposase, Mutator family [Rhodopirellula maiorica SM1]
MISRRASVARWLESNVVCRLKEQCCSEYDNWSKHDLSNKHLVYSWAGGIHGKARLEDDANKKQCFLVMTGMTSE